MVCRNYAGQKKTSIILIYNFLQKSRNLWSKVFVYWQMCIEMEFCDEHVFLSDTNDFVRFMMKLNAKNLLVVHTFQKNKPLNFKNQYYHAKKSTAEYSNNSWNSYFNQYYYLQVLISFGERVRRKQPELCEIVSWIMRHDNTPIQCLIQSSQKLNSTTTMFHIFTRSLSLWFFDLFKIKKRIEGGHILIRLKL